MPILHNQWAASAWSVYAWTTNSVEAGMHAQVVHNLLESHTLHMQRVDHALGLHALHMQIRFPIYNTTQLRMLWQIASDGDTLANFTASSEASADKGVGNLKSDILEKYWESATDTDEWIQFDAGAGKIIDVDTAAFIDNNLTSNATVRIKAYGTGSDSPPADWNTVDTYALVEMPNDPTEQNLVWISPSLPLVGYRYWRVEISDPTNPDGFIRIGRFLAGASLIFDYKENFSYKFNLQWTNYKDEIALKGFYAIANNRALRKQLTLTFQNLNKGGNENFQRMRRMLQYVRDTLKVLVIPDPQDPYDYLVYAKLNKMPAEQHNYVDAQAQYATMTLTFDEGR